MSVCEQAYSCRVRVLGFLLFFFPPLISPRSMATPLWYTLIDEGRIDELRTLQFDVNEKWVSGDLG